MLCSIWKSLPFDELPLAKGAYPVTWSNLNGFFTVTIARSFIHIPLIKPLCNVMFLTLCTPYSSSFFIHSFGVLAFGSSLLVFPVIIKFVNQTMKRTSINEVNLFCPLGWYLGSPHTGHSTYLKKPKSDLNEKTTIHYYLQVQSNSLAFVLGSPYVLYSHG